MLRSKAVACRGLSVLMVMTALHETHVVLSTTPKQMLPITQSQIQLHAAHDYDAYVKALAQCAWQNAFAVTGGPALCCATKHDEETWHTWRMPFAINDTIFHSYTIQLSESQANQFVRSSVGHAIDSAGNLLGARDGIHLHHIYVYDKGNILFQKYSCHTCYSEGGGKKCLITEMPGGMGMLLRGPLSLSLGIFLPQTSAVKDVCGSSLLCAWQQPRTNGLCTRK